MPPLFTYLLEASLVLTLLFGVYWVMLRKVTFCQLNRIVLLGIIGCSLLLPGLRVPLPEGSVHWHQALDESRHKPGEHAPALVPPLGSGSSVRSQWQDEASHQQQAATRNAFPVPATAIPLEMGLLALYLLGSAILVSKLLLELRSVWRLSKTGSRQQGDSCTLIYTAQCPTPLSFFKVIMLNPQLYTSTQLEQIIRHERVHTRQCHSLDVLVAELLAALFWFHPLVYLLKREVKLNLEYIADEQVLLEGADRKAYQYHLLRMSAPSTRLPAVSYFNFSYLKSRIHRMNMTPSTRRVVWRYGVLLPVILVLLLAIQPMKAARNTPAQALIAPAPAATPLDGRKTAATAQPSTGQASPRQEAGQWPGSTQTAPSRPNRWETSPAEPVAPAQPGDATPARTQVARTTLPPIVALESRYLVAVKQGVIAPSSISRNRVQNTTASDLARYLKLEANQSIYLAIRASLSRHELEVVTKHLGEAGVEVTFTNVLYNTQHQLTRIRLQVSLGDCKTSNGDCFAQTIEAYNDGNPLADNKPLVFYLSRRIDKVGISYGYPQELSGNDLSALRNVTGSFIGRYGE